jgi:hypothetical protein
MRDHPELQELPMSKSTKLAMAALAALSVGAACAGGALAADAAKPAVKKAAFDPKDLSGVWMQRGASQFKDYAWTPDYQKVYDKRKADMAAGNPYQPAGSSCLPRGLVGMLTSGAYPIEIFQTKNEIAINKENGGMLRIYMNRKHLAADDLLPMFFGDAVGHWEGNSLVMDSISLGGNDNIDGQAPHSDALHAVAKFTRTAADSMDVEVTIDDAKALTKPAHTVAHFKTDPGYEIQEYYCVNDRNTFSTDGQHIAGVGK